ncbi:MAG: site-specific integrase [Bacillota bacterium]|nr:site-specific integrase [Bacillota bacterium]
MQTVQPIRDIKKIDAIKEILLRDREYGARNNLLFILGINSGLRISDLLLLKLKDVLINEESNFKVFITIKEKKTGKVKHFPINKSSVKAIKNYIEQLDLIDLNEYLFKSRKGVNKPISRVQAWAVLKKAAEEAGISEAIGTHSLRKTFGYHAYQSGIDITLLQKIFNHSAPSVTLRYIGITQDEVNDVYINLNL